MPSTEQRLAEVERRLERLERLAYLAYGDLRRLADWTLEGLRAEDGEEIRALRELRALSDHEALASGLDIEDLFALKVKQRFLGARGRKDALAIAKYLADERKRDPVVLSEDREARAA